MCACSVLWLLDSVCRHSMHSVIGNIHYREKIQHWQQIKSSSISTITMLLLRRGCGSFDSTVSLKTSSSLVLGLILSKAKFVSQSTSSAMFWQAPVDTPVHTRTQCQ